MTSSGTMRAIKPFVSRNRMTAPGSKSYYITNERTTSSCLPKLVPKTEFKTWF
jgi:hypothetical protein